MQRVRVLRHVEMPATFQAAPLGQNLEPLAIFVQYLLQYSVTLIYKLWYKHIKHI